jgi:hypothetical protein
MLLNWKDRLPRGDDDSPSSPSFLKRHFDEKLKVGRSKTRSSVNTVTPSRRFLLRRTKSSDTVTVPKGEPARPSPPIASEDDSDEPKSDPEANMPVQHPKPGDRFERVIKAMQDVQLSCSPGVQHDPPQLLLRLRERELAEKDNRPGSELGPNETRTAFEADDLTSKFARPSDAPPTSMSGASSTYSQSTAQRASRMSLDTRAGIASLMTNNNTLEGLFRHQSIQFLREIASLFTNPGSAPCDWARWVVIPYYAHRDDEGMYADLDDNQDSSLEEYIVWLMYHCICGTPGCGQPGRHHARAFIHNNTKISFAVEHDIEGSSQPPTIAGELVHWCRCRQCCRVSPVSRGLPL